MSNLRISEAGTVQFPMVKHAAAIGWTPLAPEVAKQKRRGEAGMLLHDELEVKLLEPASTSCSRARRWCSITTFSARNS